MLRIVRIEGHHKCNSYYVDCNNEYEWTAVIDRSMNSLVPEVETLHKPIGNIIETIDGHYVIKIICPKCQEDNIIIYQRTE